MYLSNLKIYFSKFEISVYIDFDFTFNKIYLIIYIFS